MESQNTMSRAANFIDTYSNTVRIGITPFDISIIFGRISEKSIGDSAVEDIAQVRVSPHFFKNLVNSLQNTINSWESAFGTITETMPHADQSTFESATNLLKEALSGHAKKNK
jgi:hypothetical protein